MTFNKGFLIAVFSMAMIALSSAGFAQTTDAKATAAAQPAVTETKPAAKVEAPVAAKTEAPAAVKTEDDAKPKAEAPTQPQNAPSNIEKGASQLRAEQKVDIKNLPKNLTPLILRDGDVLILSVGETKLLTAARPRVCLNKEAPSFDDTKLRLPVSDIISYSDGGLYERFSQRCGGLMPARAIFATGVKAGSQKLFILGANLSIVVK